MMAVTQACAAPTDALACCNSRGSQITPISIHGSDRGGQRPDDGPVILYFHGWGDDYRVALPLEYPLVDARYQLLVVHRPGYAGTALEGIVDGETFDRRSAEGSAHTAAALLRFLYGDSWRISVIGTSGGAPAALAFASLYPDETKALILQAGVAQPWTDAQFVPELFRATYLTAFKRFGWAGDQVSQIIFGLLVKSAIAR